MEKISALLGIKKQKEKIHDSPQPDPMSIEYFKQMNLSRDRFSYDILLDIGLWPDDILLFLEVIRIAYSDFISTYSLQANIFDEAIRNITWFMNQRNYNKLPWVATYLRRGQYEIPDGYLNYMIAEDNCYMREIEDRKRSENETKHYYLFKAIQDVLEDKDSHSISSQRGCNAEGDIAVGDIKLSKEYEDKLRLYVCVYSLKITYCITDDMCRNMLSTSITCEKKNINMTDFVGDMCIDMDERILPHLKIINDRKMYNKFYIFRDILTYIHHVSLNFNHVFKYKKDPRPFTNNISHVSQSNGQHASQTNGQSHASQTNGSAETNINIVDEKVSSGGQTGLIIDENNKTIESLGIGKLQPSVLFDDETIYRVESVFKYFLSILMDHHRKSYELIEGGKDIVDIMKKDKSSLTSIKVPIYNVVWKDTDVKVEKMFGQKSASPREDELKNISINLHRDEDIKVTRSPRGERKLSFSSTKSLFSLPNSSTMHVSSPGREDKSFTINLSGITNRVIKKQTRQRKYSTDVILLTPRKD